MATNAICTSVALLMSEDTSSSGDSDEEFHRQIPALILASCREDKPKVQDYIEAVVPLYKLDDFRRFFRLSRPTFEKLCEQFGTLHDEFDFLFHRKGGRQPIPLEKQLLVFLWYVGSLEPLCRIADRFNITEFSILRIRNRFCSIILRHFKSKYIVWPEGQEKQAVIERFREKRGFPHVVGALDSTHIEIRPPKEHSQTYVNRKGYHSIILQCVCREDMRYIHCFSGWPGSVHDSRVLKNSDLWQTGQTLCADAHLIGDGGFPLKQWLLTPFRDNGHLTQQQRHYNFCLSSTRQVIERSFSLLKGRFRRLRHIDVHNIETAVKLCVSCCVLHNICILQSEDLDDFFDDDNDLIQNRAAVVQDNDAAGIRKRQHIAQTLP